MCGGVEPHFGQMSKEGVGKMVEVFWVNVAGCSVGDGSVNPKSR